MRVPDEFLGSVGFVCVKRVRDGVERFDIGGTGFFVKVPSETYPNEIEYTYFVTAKHNVERASKYGPIFLRLNTKQGGLAYVGVQRLWTTNTARPGVDLAAVAFGAQGVLPLDLHSIPEHSLAYAPLIDRLKIGIGDDLIVVGLFTQRYGIGKNIPIIRTGIIAAMPEENLTDDNGDTYSAYLAEVRSIGGLSGSPVIVVRDPQRPAPIQIEYPKQPYRPLYMLLGVIRGHWDIEKKMTKKREDFIDNELEQVNMGIAIVTPIQDLQSILHSEEMVKARKEQDKDYAEQMRPTLDSGFPEGRETAEPFTKEKFEDALKKASRKKV
jgi:hypothetical protein